MKNKISYIDAYTLGIHLNSKKLGESICLIDKEDLPRILAIQKWHPVFFNGKPYCSANICRNGSISIHRLILSFPDGKSIDHINGNALDNRKKNLRICSHSENTKNRKPNKGKKYKGIWFNKKTSKWVCEICSNGIKYRSTNFNTEKEAAIAYNLKAIELHGSFASINSIT